MRNNVKETNETSEVKETINTGYADSTDNETEEEYVTEQEIMDDFGGLYSGWYDYPAPSISDDLEEASIRYPYFYQLADENDNIVFTKYTGESSLIREKKYLVRVDDGSEREEIDEEIYNFGREANWRDIYREEGEELLSLLSEEQKQELKKEQPKTIWDDSDELKIDSYHGWYWYLPSGDITPHEGITLLDNKVKGSRFIGTEQKVIQIYEEYGIEDMKEYMKHKHWHSVKLDTHTKYKKYERMSRRCYDTEFQERWGKQAYADVSICDEWDRRKEGGLHRFYEWLDENYWEMDEVEVKVLNERYGTERNKLDMRMNIDHNMIDPTNKVYCPEKCIVVPGFINNYYSSLTINPDRIKHLKHGYSTDVIDLGERHHIKGDTYKEVLDKVCAIKQNGLKIRTMFLYNRVPNELFNLLRNTDVKARNKEAYAKADELDAVGSDGD